MAVAVKVKINQALLTAATTGPGGSVSAWRDEVISDILRVARSTSPINDPLNATHRGGVVGVFAAAWGSDTSHANQYGATGTVYNTAAHAEFVEFGRSPSTKRQRFSWTNFDPPGSIRQVRKTGPRAGRHVLRDATNATMPGATGGVYIPLV